MYLPGHCLLNFFYEMAMAIRTLFSNSGSPRAKNECFEGLQGFCWNLAHRLLRSLIEDLSSHQASGGWAQDGA